MHEDYCRKPRGFIENQRGFPRKSSWINRESTRIYAVILVDRSKINEDFRANPRGLRTWTLNLIHVRSTWNQCPILEESLYDPRGISVDDPRGYPRNFFQLGIFAKNYFKWRRATWRPSRKLEKSKVGKGRNSQELVAANARTRVDVLWPAAARRLPLLGQAPRLYRKRERADWPSAQGGDACCCVRRLGGDVCSCARRLRGDAPCNARCSRRALSEPRRLQLASHATVSFIPDSEGFSENKMEQLKKRWQEFEQNHQKLSEDGSVDLDDAYFKTGQYDIVYETFLTNMGLFQDQLLQVKRETMQLSAQPGVDGIIAEMDVNRTKLPQIVINDFSAPQVKSESKVATTTKGRKSSNFVQAKQEKPVCPVCSEAHTIEQCSKFRRQSVGERKQTLGRKRLCYNCLGAHMIKDCKSNITCYMCNGKHHTLIHAPSKKSGAKSASDEKDGQTSEDLDSSASTSQNVLAVASNGVCDDALEALLATARIRVLSGEGQFATVRALVDQCAQSSFITEELCQKLRLKKRQVNVPISGIGQGPANSRSEVEITIRPHFKSQFELMLKAYVLPVITSYRPLCRSPEDWPHIKGLQLADPHFARPGRVDVLLSMQIHARIMQEGLKTGDVRSPIAMKSHLGWILSGSAEKPGQGGTIVCLQVDDQLNDQLKSFWEVEEPPHVLPWSKEDKQCEEHFQRNTVRLPDGRYQVRLPLKCGAPLD
ncbi:unnamed protein product [Trichogramma brassicae]|uniref:Uncharacterized protein n=1 Tax=Trichogramma brassicae TaxID=86971 RepID=A0A6H5HVD2_9HYME|nr:unnamed protein product [Trichogramma brassicae]